MASRPPPPSSFPAFRVPHQEGFATCYDAVVALERELPDLSVRNVVGKDASTVLVPLDEPSYQSLLAVAGDAAAQVKLSVLDPSLRVTRAVVMGYPHRLPTDLLLRNPQFESAERCQSRKTRDLTRQVVVTVRGPVPASVSLGNWGTFYLRPYTPEPLRCFRCQRFGHHQANCARPQVCGVCSGLHETRLCLDRFKAKEPVTHRCPNCSGAHHAWNPSCPVRTQWVDRGRVRQVDWVQQQQSVAAVPAPPGTFVWGQQRRAQPPAPVSLEQFPPLLPPSAAPAPPPSPLPARPSRRPATRSQGTQATPPAATAPPLTVDLVRILGTEIAVGVASAVASVVGAQLDADALTRLADNVVEQCVTRLFAGPSAQSPAPPPPPLGRRVSSLPDVRPSRPSRPSSLIPRPLSPLESSSPGAVPKTKPRPGRV